MPFLGRNIGRVNRVQRIGTAVQIILSKWTGKTVGQWTLFFILYTDRILCGGLSMSITGANNHHLIVMLYEQAIRFLHQAIRDMREENFTCQTRNVRKAQAIIDELNSVLDMDAGGDVAKNLRAIYNFMIQHLTEASNDCDVGLIHEVISQLEELNGSWKVITD
jgi:flagellar protein FliS